MGGPGRAWGHGDSRWDPLGVQDMRARGVYPTHWGDSTLSAAGCSPGVGDGGTQGLLHPWGLSLNHGGCHQHQGEQSPGAGAVCKSLAWPCSLWLGWPWGRSAADSHPGVVSWEAGSLASRMKVPITVALPPGAVPCPLLMAQPYQGVSMDFNRCGMLGDPWGHRGQGPWTWPLFGGGIWGRNHTLMKRGWKNSCGRLELKAG